MTHPIPLSARRTPSRSGRWSLAATASALVALGAPLEARPQSAAPGAQGTPGETGSPAQESSFLDGLEGLEPALRGGDFWLSMRYRFEAVDQDGFAREGRASTMRTHIGYQTAPWHDFVGLVELENVSDIGADDKHNNRKNQEFGRPVTADAPGSSVNQAYLEYGGAPGTTVRAGRQRITLDNERFIARRNWRQRQQVFDAATASVDVTDDLHLFASWVGATNTPFRTRSETDGGIVNARYDIPGVGSVTGYWYYVDFAKRFLQQFSTSTIGARLTGSTDIGKELELRYTAEYASQADVGDNPNDVDADYLFGEIGLTSGPMRATLGQEVLGGSRRPGDRLTTPFGALHRHNGWADKFTFFPGVGLRDTYLEVGSSDGPMSWAVIAHDFRADATSADLGWELDLTFSYDVSESASVALIVADYHGKDAIAPSLVDTTKVFLLLSLWI